jgi:hypothetical protein
LGWVWTISRLLKIQTPARTRCPSRSSIKCSEIYRWTWLGVYWGQSLVSFKSWLQLCTRRWTWWILDNYSLLLCTRCILEMTFQESKWNLVWHAYTMPLCCSLALPDAYLPLSQFFGGNRSCYLVWIAVCSWMWNWSRMALFSFHLFCSYSFRLFYFVLEGTQKFAWHAETV